MGQRRCKWYKLHNRVSAITKSQKRGRGAGGLHPMAKSQGGGRDAQKDLGKCNAQNCTEMHNTSKPEYK